MTQERDSAPTNVPQRYNDLFEQFVDPDNVEDSETALSGFVAYSLYKWAKREWMQRFCAENDGRQPNAAEIRIFTLSWNDAMIAGKRVEAERVLAEFAEYVVAKERPAIVKKAIEGRFISEVMAGILAAFLWTGFLILVALGLKLGGIDVVHFYTGIGPTAPH